MQAGYGLSARMNLSGLDRRRSWQKRVNMRGMPDARSRGVDDQGCPLADKVLAYLVQHPQARDTTEGIVEWWLLEQRIQCAIADVEAALSDLVRKDFLITHQCSDGRISYGLNREREREIRRHLRRAEEAHTATDRAEP